MNIGIIDADIMNKTKHRFPNLACMKLSGWHKRNGHEVSLLTSYDNILDYDKVFISKVFTDTVVPDDVLSLNNVCYGGTGFFYDMAKPLPFEIEHGMPDYHLYDSFVMESLSNKKMNQSDAKYYTDYSIGFMTRGCIRQCSFCVNKNFKQCNRHSYVNEFLDISKPYIVLLDDNVLACKDWKNIFEELNATGKRFRFHQGMDERLLTDEKCSVIFKSKWIGEYYFAFDNIQDASLIERKLNLIRKHTNRRVKFYCLCAYNHANPGILSQSFWKQDINDLFERIWLLVKYKAYPYVMRYKDYEISPYRGMYITIARWANQPNFLAKKSFREFCYSNGDNSASVKYMLDFEKDCPDIASKYFDVKYDDVCIC